MLKSKKCIGCFNYVNGDPDICNSCVGFNMYEQGKKFDSGKTRYDLVPPNTLKEVADVLTFGSKKYSDDNWKKVSEPNKRYYSAAIRHIEAWRNDELIDSESGHSHLAHAICCLVFLNES